ncbi:MAG: XRE family transcriptional regulator [Gammaproteobacteria bacterium PRO9]|nr:XRE family transcriptional regulator [Gammaproteobacteria bacterium PRO9]
MRFELQEFARRLQAEMQKRGWTQADLARAAFGSTKDSRGYNVARGRDRISVYLRGLQKPDQAHLGKIAAALSVTAEDLAPGLFANSIDREHPAFRVNVVPGHSDKAHLVINRLVPMAMAMKIGQMISTLDDDT